MSKLFRGFIVCFLSGLAIISPARQSFSDSSLDEARQLLQKSLTLYELDQEIARLSDQEAQLNDQIDQADADIGVKEQQVTETRDHAGKVLRAYYMGDRKSIWLLLFQARSFSDALVMYDYLNMIVQNDERALTVYRTSYQELTAMKDDLEAKRTDLEQVKEAFIQQRDRAVALQTEVNQQLQTADNAGELEGQIQDLTKQWQEKGIPLFQTYFKAISDAMQSLPELISGDNRGHYLTGSLAAPVFQITDAELNTFFRSKNELLSNMAFTFSNGQFAAAGKDNGIEISIKGHYTVENDPVNRLQFHVDELTFNGFVLPDTTNRSLEQQFNLGFTPQDYLPFIQVTDVVLADGRLTIKMKTVLNAGAGTAKP